MCTVKRTVGWALGGEVRCVLEWREARDDRAGE